MAVGCWADPNEHGPFSNYSKKFKLPCHESINEDLHKLKKIQVKYGFVGN
jgi:hypothetical protein